MKNQKIKAITIATATILTISSVIAPINIYAQTELPPPTVSHEISKTQTKKPAPNIIVPDNLEGYVGQPLHDITLPENWNWEDEMTIINKDKIEYPARITVDDATYDYSNVAGYNANDHYVECNVSIIIKEQEPVGSSQQLNTVRTINVLNNLSAPKAGDIEINAINFPDNTFRDWLEQQNFGKDRIIKQEEIRTITYINLSSFSDSVKIENLQGIEHFTELQSLYCYGSNAKPFNLKKIDVSNNAKLKTINCSNNPNLTSLIVKGADALDILNCSETKITELDVSNNNDLRILYCNTTELTSLDVSNNTALEQLNCYNTKLSSLDVSMCTVLKEFNCRNTPLIWLNIGDNQNMVTCSLPTPTIITTNINSDTFNIKDIASNIDLKKINIISNGTLNENTGVISNYDKNLPIEYEYDCGEVKGQTKKMTVTLDKLVVDINETNFPDDTFRKYVKEFDRDKNEKLSIGEIAKVTTLYADGKNGKGAIKSLKGIEYFSALEKLYCYNTQITELDVSKNTALVHLSCGDTPLLKLNISENKALEYLDFADTKITEFDISKNLNLKVLGCANTEVKKIEVTTNLNLEQLHIRNTRIDQLDVTNNKKLTHLDCAKTNITSLNVSNNPALIHLYCDNLGIDKLKVINNPNLTVLWCHETNIKELDISKNTALVTLECYKTKLQNLDVSKNTELTTLSCSQTPIKELDVTMLSKLEYLYTWATDIKYLDVSQNPNLVTLDTPRTNLGYLDWGNNDLNELYMDSSSTIDLVVDSNTFNIKEKFKGIDISKINMISGGFLDKDSGNIKDYAVGTPIIYEYTCGTFNNAEKILTVTLNLFKSPSTIDIKENLDMIYTGKSVADPTIDKTGSKGKTTFTYEIWNNNTWQIYSGKPINVGTYRVTAHLAEDDFFASAQATKEFTILQATNIWTQKPAITDWTYGDKPNQPTGDTQFGNDIVYSYSKSKNGPFTNVVPSDTGTWYVKAKVSGTDDYTGLESVIAFTINPKEISDKDITISDIKDLDSLIIINGDKKLDKDIDYIVNKKQDGNKVTVTITFKGNYSGTINKTYTANIEEEPKAVAIKTGDNSYIGVFTGLLVISLGLMVLINKRKMN